MNTVTYTVEFCTVLEKPWREATLAEFIYECPKAFQYCQTCECCKQIQRTEAITTTTISRIEAF